MKQLLYSLDEIETVLELERFSKCLNSRSIRRFLEIGFGQRATRVAAWVIKGRQAGITARMTVLTSCDVFSRASLRSLESTRICVYSEGIFERALVAISSYKLQWHVNEEEGFVVKLKLP